MEKEVLCFRITRKTARTDLNSCTNTIFYRDILKDAWSDLADFIGDMVAQYAGETGLDNLPNPDIYLRGKWMKQLYREFYKEKNITKFRNTKISVDRKMMA